MFVLCNYNMKRNSLHIEWLHTLIIFFIATFIFSHCTYDRKRNKFTHRVTMYFEQYILDLVVHGLFWHHLCSLRFIIMCPLQSKRTSWGICEGAEQLRFLPGCCLFVGTKQDIFISGFGKQWKTFFTILQTK